MSAQRRHPTANQARIHLGSGFALLAQREAKGPRVTAKIALPIFKAPNNSTNWVPSPHFARPGLAGRMPTPFLLGETCALAPSLLSHY